jgi:SAM-dependent methyltransferase
MTGTEHAYQQSYIQEAERGPREARLSRARKLLQPVWPYLGTDVLEIGCSSGEALQLMRDSGRRPMGIDVGQSMIDEARSVGLDARCVAPDAALPFPSESFDSVYASHVLEHTYSPFPLLLEIRRVLRPGGHAVIIVPNSMNLRRSAFVRGHVSYYDVDNIYYSLRAAGLAPLLIKTDLPAAGRIERALPLTPGNWASPLQRSVLRFLPIVHLGINLYAVAKKVPGCGPNGFDDCRGEVGGGEERLA